MITIDVDSPASPELWTIAQPKQEKETRPTKSVRFQNTVSVRFTQTRLDRKDILPFVHYTRDEYKWMKRQSTVLALHIQRGRFSNDTDIESKRGLENLTRAGAMKYEERRKFGLDAVLREQTKQRRRCDIMPNPERIAEAYGEIGRICAADAAKRGYSDAVAMQRIIMEENGDTLDSHSCHATSSGHEQSNPSTLVLSGSERGTRQGRSRTSRTVQRNGLKEILRWTSRSPLRRRSRRTATPSTSTSLTTSTSTTTTTMTMTPKSPAVETKAKIGQNANTEKSPMRGEC